MDGSVTSEAKTVLQNYLDALVAGDLARVADSFAPDATWTLHGVNDVTHGGVATLPLAGTRHGRDQIMDFLVSAGSLFEPGSQQFSFGEVLGEGSTVVLEWRVTGTGSATGLRYDNEYCGVFTVEGARITSVREYLDTLHAHTVLF